MEIEDNRTYRIPLGCYKNPQNFKIEPDAATASYDMAFAVLNNLKVQISHLDQDSCQGDFLFTQKLKKLGVIVESGSLNTVVDGRSFSVLRNVDFNFGDCTDTFITMAVILSNVDGVSYIRGISN